MKNSERLNDPLAVVFSEIQPESDDGDNKITIRLQLVQLSPDPQQFKPYSPQFKPPEDQPIQVAVQVERKYVKAQKEDGTIVLSARGLAKIAQLICIGIAQIHVQEDN